MIAFISSSPTFGLLSLIQSPEYITITFLLLTCSKFAGGSRSLNLCPLETKQVVFLSFFYLAFSQSALFFVLQASFAVFKGLLIARGQKFQSNHVFLTHTRHRLLPLFSPASVKNMEQPRVGGNLNMNSPPLLVVDFSA